MYDLVSYFLYSNTKYKKGSTEVLCIIIVIVVVRLSTLLRRRFKPPVWSRLHGELIRPDAGWRNSPEPWVRYSGASGAQKNFSVSFKQVSISEIQLYILHLCFYTCVRRERRRQKQVETEKRLAEEELRHQVLLHRQRAIRQFRQRQLHLMEILPAGNTHMLTHFIYSPQKYAFQKWFPRNCCIFFSCREIVN